MPLLQGLRAIYSIDSLCLNQMAEFEELYHWDGRIANKLGLTQADVAALKTKHPTDLKLQMYGNL